MNVWTKRGADIVAPTDAAGNPRKVVNGEMQTWMTEVERLFKAGAFNSVDAVGLYTDRSTYDSEAEGFVYLSIDGDGAGSSSAVVFIKESAASGDWSPPVPFQGDKGWSPLFRAANDDARRVVEVYDWVGGEGEKPAQTGYIGASGLTANIAEAVDIRGPQGVSGSGLSWSFDAGTSDEDPGAGNLRANAGDLSAATELFVSKVSAGGDPVASFLAGLTNSTSTHKGYLILTEPSSGAQATYDVTGTTDAAGYVKIAVSGHSGAATLTDAALLSVVFSRTGNAGDLNGVNPGAVGLAVLGAETGEEARTAIGALSTDAEAVGTSNLADLSVTREKLSAEVAAAIASTPLFYGAKGDAGSNLLKGADFDLLSWGAPTLTGVVSGVNAFGEDAYLFTEDAASGHHYTTRVTSEVSANQDMTVSVLVKAGTRDEIRLYAASAGVSNNNAFAYFDLASQTVLSIGAGTLGDGEAYSAEVIDVGGGWFQCRFFCRPTTSGNYVLRLYISTAENNSFNTPGSGTVYLSGPQVALGDVVTNPYGTDDATALNAGISALPKGGVLDGLGKAYRADSTLVLKSGVTLRNMILDFSRAPNGDTLISADGSLSAAVSLTASAVAGATSISLASVSGLAENDLLWVSSTGTFASLTDVKLGEMARIKSISGSTVTFTAPLSYGYTTSASAQIEKLNFVEDITLEGVKAFGSGPGGTQRGAVFQIVKDLTITGCRFSDFDTQNILVNQSAFVNIHRTRTDRALQAGMAYGINISYGCHWVNITECSGERVRHAVAIGGKKVNRFIKVSNCNAFGCLDAGFDCHPAGDHIDFINNYVVVDPNAGGEMDGIITQGGNTKLIGNTVIGSKQYSVFHQCLVDYGDPSSIVTDNIVRGDSPTFGVYVVAQGTATMRRVSIERNSVEGHPGGVRLHALTGSIDTFTISGNTFYEPLVGTASLVLVDADGTKKIYHGAIVGNSGRVAPAAAAGIHLSAENSPNIQYVTISGNSIFDGAYGIKCENTDWINVNGNQFPSATTKVLLVGAASAEANNLPI